MRIAIASAAVGLLSVIASGLSDAQAPTAVQVPAESGSMPQMVPPPVVHLYGVSDLERLRKSDLYHYLRARKILAAANEICRPRPEPTFLARFNDTLPACGPMWMTSLPPKKLLRFRLDGVYYVALVTVVENAKALSVREQKAVKPH